MDTGRDFPTSDETRPDRAPDARANVHQRRQVFDERTRRYAERGYDRIEAARFVAAVLDPVGGHVLDVGTGKGLLALALAARGASVVTVDPDPADQELAALLGREAGVAGRLHVVTADASALPYPDGHFAAAASMDVLHHLTDPEPVLQDMVRTLNAHGELLLADFSREGFELVARIHGDEGRVHAESGVTLEHAAALLHRWGFATVLRFTRHLHDIAVFARQTGSLGQDTLDDIRRLSHPHCLVCGRESPNGLHLDFGVQPDRSVHATFQGGSEFQGYPDAIHGGLVAMLLESAMTSCLFSRGIVGVTASLDVRYLGPSRWYRPCAVTATLDRTARGVHYLTAEVRQEGCTVARASGRFAARPRVPEPTTGPVAPMSGETAR